MSAFLCILDVFPELLSSPIYSGGSVLDMRSIRVSQVKPYKWLVNINKWLNLRQERLSIIPISSGTRDSTDKNIAASLDEQTVEGNEESFVVVLQHAGGNDVTC